MGDTSQQTLAKVDMYGTGAAGVLGMVSAYKNSRARKRAAKIMAQQARRKGEDEIRIAGIKTGRLFGAQRAAFAANGLDIAGSDTVRQVLADTSEEGVREAVMIRNNSASEAQEYRTKAASESPVMEALGVGLGATGTVASKWYTYNKSGVFDPVDEGETKKKVGFY